MSGILCPIVVSAITDDGVSTPTIYSPAHNVKRHTSVWVDIESRELSITKSTSSDWLYYIDLQID